MSFSDKAFQNAMNRKNKTTSVQKDTRSTEEAMAYAQELIANYKPNAQKKAISAYLNENLDATAYDLAVRFCLSMDEATTHINKHN